MFNYTQAAKERDEYARNGGPRYSEHHQRIQNDALYATRHDDALFSIEHEAKQRELDREAASAMRAEDERLAEVEGRILHPRNKNHINIHGD